MLSQIFYEPELIFTNQLWAVANFEQIIEYQPLKVLNIKYARSQVKFSPVYDNIDLLD